MNQSFILKISILRDSTDEIKKFHFLKFSSYGRTRFKDGRVEEGKYKNNSLIASEKKHKFPSMLRISKMSERTEASVANSKLSSQIALQKAEIAAARHDCLILEKFNCPFEIR